MTGRYFDWTDRLLVRSGRLLAGGLVMVLVTMSLSLYLSRYDGQLRGVQEAVGESATVGGAVFRIERIYRLGKLPGAFDVQAPVSGATFVVADLTADLRAAADESCSMYLKAGEYYFYNEYSYRPTDPSYATSCEGGGKATISVAFQVPVRLVERVDGVRIDMREGDGLAQTVIPGRLVE